MLPELKDSGERSTYSSGAQRDNHEGKGRFDLMSIQGLLRLARHYERGSKKYSSRNWEQGMPISRYVDAAFRHLIKYMAGCDDEDHLAAVAWNVFCIMHHEDERPDMQDLPWWEGRTSKWIVPLDKGVEVKPQKTKVTVIADDAPLYTEDMIRRVEG